MNVERGDFGCVVRVGYEDVMRIGVWLDGMGWHGRHGMGWDEKERMKGGNEGSRME